MQWPLSSIINVISIYRRHWWNYGRHRFRVCSNKRTHYRPTTQQTLDLLKVLYSARFGPSFRSGRVDCVVEGLCRLSHYSLSKRAFIALLKLAKIKQSEIKMCCTLLISTSSEQFYKGEVWLTHVGLCRSEQISVRGQAFKAKQAKYVFRYQSLFH